MSSDFVNVKCGKCGYTFGMPKDIYNARIYDGDIWYCPLGHIRHFVDSDASREQRELEWLRKKNLGLLKKIEDLSKRPCPVCGKMFHGDHGVNMHMRHMHFEEWIARKK